RRRRGARSRVLAADRVAVLLRHRPSQRGRDDRRPPHRRGGARGDRRHVARLSLARGSTGGDAATRVRAVPGLPHAQLPDPGTAKVGQAALRSLAQLAATRTIAWAVDQTGARAKPARPLIGVANAASGGAYAAVTSPRGPGWPWRCRGRSGTRT